MLKPSTSSRSVTALEGIPILQIDRFIKVSFEDCREREGEFIEKVAKGLSPSRSARLYHDDQ